MSNIKKRDSARGAIQRYMQQSQKATIVTVNELECQLKLLEEQWQRLRTAQELVELEGGGDFLAIEEETIIQVETWYLTTYSNFHSALSNLTASDQATPIVYPPRSTPQMPLPKLVLTTFSGDSTEWISFQDSFQSLIDSNASLSDAQKLQYLRTCLQGEALSVINNFQITNANYAEAWGLPRSRYEVHRVIVEKHLFAIFAVETVKEDSALAIKTVIDPILQHTRALKALGRTVEFLDDVLVHIVISKLAFQTRKEWELSLQSPDVPNFEQLQHFLETRCRSLEMVCSKNSPVVKPMNRNVPRRGQGFAATSLHAEAAKQKSAAPYEENKKYLFCNNSHKIYKCDEFQRLAVNAK